ncbi:uncharacterized protein LOC125505786 [Dendroctonus ponderosae]|uniref:uncharacterized protein LOC125505786 n=1 Tax=Dendroctonus ponderosae TaxID=77166 RepID=UPI0020351F94|nr:uncharacterized protein LOC125505786 [Dendroctonus ponderosae]
MATYRPLSRKVRVTETTGSGARDVFKPTWFAYENIDRFIKATGKKTATLSSEESETKEANSRNEQDLLQHEEVEEHTNEPDHETIKDVAPKRIDANFTFPPRALGNKRRIGPNITEANINKHLKLASDALATFAAKSQPQIVQDSPALYGKLLAMKLRQLKPRTQIVLQNEIDNLVFQAQLSEIDSVGTTAGRSVTTNFISQNSIPAQYSSPSGSHFSSSSSCVGYPAPAHFSKENLNSNSPEPFQTSQENDNQHLYSQSISKPVSVGTTGDPNFYTSSPSNNTSLLTYYTNVHDLLNSKNHQ